jgi:hypothetical protein
VKLRNRLHCVALVHGKAQHRGSLLQLARGLGPGAKVSRVGYEILAVSGSDKEAQAGLIKYASYCIIFGSTDVLLFHCYFILFLM